VEYGLLMSDEKRAEGDPQDSGVFGKLPSARPGVRSPRRQTGGKKGRPARAKKTSESATEQVGEESPPSASERLDSETASPRVRPSDTAGHSSAAPPPTQPRATPETETEPGATPGEGPGVEDLAWAGITVAAEAATLGVRLLSRAVEAVRGPADRR
jgi:hypothetical protein